MTWSEFLAMGGYGAYVWSAYGLAALVLLWNVLIPWLNWRSAVRNLRRLTQNEDLS